MSKPRRFELQDFPDEILEKILYELPSPDLAAACNSSKQLSQLCGSRSLRVNSMTRLYASKPVESKRILAELLCTTTTVKGLERIQGLLIAHPELSTSSLSNKPYTANYPLEYAFNPLTFDTLLRYGADPRQSSKAHPEWREFYAKGRASLKEVEGSEIGPTISLLELLVLLPSEDLFRLCAKYKVVSPTPLPLLSLACARKNCNLAIFILEHKLDRNIDERTMLNLYRFSNFLLRRLVPLIDLDQALSSAIASLSFDLVRFLVRYGADLNQHGILLYGPLAQSDDEEVIEMRKLLTQILAVRNSLSKLVPNVARKYFLQHDLAIIAACQDIASLFWNDEGFWAEKYKMDFGSEPMVNGNPDDTWRKKYYRQITTPLMVIEHKGQKTPLCLNYHEGRGFLFLWGLLFQEKGMKIIEVKRMVWRQGDSYILTISRLFEQYGLERGFWSEQDLVLGTTTILKGEEVYKGRVLPTNLYTAIFSNGNKSYTVQFDHPDFIRGYFILCSVLMIRPQVSSLHLLI